MTKRKLWRVFLKGAAVVAVLAAVGAGAWFGRKVPVAEQWPLFDALRNTAAIIFAVVGAWMAIIFPERLKAGFKRNGAAAVAGGDGWTQLFTPVVHSTCILVVLLVLGAALPLLRHSQPGFPLEVMRGGLFGLLVLLTCWQVWTVLQTLRPADTAKSTVDQAMADAQLAAGRFLVTVRPAGGGDSAPGAQAGTAPPAPGAGP